MSVTGNIMKRSLKTLLWSIAAFAGIISVGVATGFIHARFEQRRARDIMGRISAMRVGKTDYQALNNLAAQAGAGQGMCTSDRCSIYLRYENSVLGHLHLAPLTWFSAYLTTSDGVLSDIQINAMSARENGQTGVAIFESSRFQPDPDACVVPQRESLSSMPSQVFIRLNAGGPQQLRASVYSLDLSCFSTLGGCTSASELTKK